MEAAWAVRVKSRDPWRSRCMDLASDDPLRALEISRTMDRAEIAAWQVLKIARSEYGLRDAT